MLFVAPSDLRFDFQELGVTPPLGFWDPLGFSKYENPEVCELDSGMK